MSATSSLPDNAVDRVDPLPVHQHTTLPPFPNQLHNNVFGSSTRARAVQSNSWPTIQFGWKKISNLRTELLSIDSDSKRAWEQIWKQKAACDGACDRLSNITDGLQPGAKLNQAAIDQLRGFGTLIRSENARLTSMRHGFQRLQERRADAEFRLSEEESMVFEQLERLLGPLPDALSMKPNPSQDNEDAESSVDLPHPLKKYYEAVGWVGVLRERLDDLRYDHMESEEARNPSFQMSRSLSSNGSSNLRFQRQELELEEQLERAQREADGWEKQCITDQIDIAIRPGSSRISSAPSPGYRDEDMADNGFGPPALMFSPSLAQGARPNETHLSRSHLRLAESSQPHRPATSKTVSFVNRWMQNLWGQSHGRSRDFITHDDPEGFIDMRSTHSLPDYVMVDKLPQDWRASSDSEPDAHVELLQKQAEIGMSMMRKFAHKRPYHSDSSLLSDPVNKTFLQFRRATCHELGRRTELALQRSTGDHAALEAAFQEIASISPV